MKEFIVKNYTKTLKIKDSERLLPIGKIYCVGKNYKDHIKEMNDSNIDEPPFFFSKPPQSLTQDNSINFPNDTDNLHYEVELVVYIAKKCKSLSVKEVQNYILGYSVGIDLTKRDQQMIAKRKSQPWDLSKGFDNSAPVSEIFLCNKILDDADIKLKLNDEIKQSSNISNMTWDVAKIISYLSNKITLYPGDAIFTGTPSGVGSIERFDEVKAMIDGVGEMTIFFN